MVHGLLSCVIFSVGNQKLLFVNAFLVANHEQSQFSQAISEYSRTYRYQEAERVSIRRTRSRRNRRYYESSCTGRKNRYSCEVSTDGLVFIIRFSISHHKFTKVRSYSFAQRCERICEATTTRRVQRFKRSCFNSKERSWRESVTIFYILNYRTIPKYKTQEMESATSNIVLVFLAKKLYFQAGSSKLEQVVLSFHF